MLNTYERKDSVQNWIKSTFNDTLTIILLNNSHLTKIQAETLLIDNLAENMLDRKMGYEEKAKMRMSTKGVSRGAFNRTLHQANKNITASIYTIFFLGYLGILETPSLDEFIETSNKLAIYVKEHRTLLNSGVSELDDIKRAESILNLKKELISSLNRIVSRENINDKM